ncbi:MAG TPA: ice-binding family protein, partial [Candidatus Paceibacterota bacterium]|nr:ice-binding family protein [Candidatus Paceibacterota bacterium]
FIFQMASTLTTTSGRQVILAGGAQADNVFWQVGSSATIGTSSVFKGNILAQASITVTTGATVDGRLLARTGAVTLDSNEVNSTAELKINNVSQQAEATQATISWTTSVPSTGTLLYSLDTPVDITDSATTAVEDTTLSTSHSLTINGLQPGTLYYYFIVARDAPGSSFANSQEFSFTTLLQGDTTAPVIAAHDNITTDATSADGAVVTYTSPTATDNVDATVVVTCLPASGTTFPIGVTKVKCNATDAAGNHAVETSFEVLVTAISISNVSAQTGTTEATINWTTSVPSTGTIIYSLVTPVDPSDSATVFDEDTTLSTNHSHVVTGLQPGTRYYYYVEAGDEPGNNFVSSPESSFITNMTVEIKDMAFDPSVLNVKTGTKVTWINNDTVPHTVTADSGSLFDSGILSPGQSFSFKFTDLGTVNYHCTVHPSMTGSVTVTQ